MTGYAAGGRTVSATQADTVRGLPDFLVGDGFYKLGYVTTDREQAIAALQAQYGFEDFYRFEPDLEVETEQGERGRAHLQCAFTAGRNIIVEVMQPLDGLVGIFSQPLAEKKDFQLTFHHIGVLVEDFDSANAQMKSAGLPPVWECRQDGFIEVSYHRLPMFGHMVEIVWYGPQSNIGKLRGGDGGVSST